MSTPTENEPPGYREHLLKAMRELVKQSSGLTLVTRGKESERIPLETIERDGEVLLVFPDMPHNQRRIQRWISSKQDRVFWTNLTVACGSPGEAANDDTDAAGNLAKRGGSLPAARQDVDAFYEYYQPAQVGEPNVLLPGRWSVLSAGYYSQTIPLDNPTSTQLFAALGELRDWVESSRDNPEYLSHQINFSFSGHGVVSGAGAGPALQLADRAVSAAELAAHFINTLPNRLPAPVRLDLYLDCCHSGAIAQALVNNLQFLRQGIDRGVEPPIEVGQIYCACLDDEESFEFTELSHGAFSFAFLNECSTKRPEGAVTRNLGLRDVGWFTAGKQHPMLLDFTSGKGCFFKFPSQYYLSHPPHPDFALTEPFSPEPDPLMHQMDTIGELLRLARLMRALCLPVELAMQDDARLRKDFSRGEIRTNTRFPFL